MNLRKNSEVAKQPKTDMEMMMMVQQSMSYLMDKVNALQKENAAKDERLAITEPKAETLNKITATKNDVSVRELAAILVVPGLGQNNLFKLFQKDGYIDCHNHPYRQHIEAGLMYEKEHYISQLDSTKRQLRITQKGVAYFARKYCKAEVLV
jgi:phage antirepressor YoqD-like protein